MKYFLKLHTFFKRKQAHSKLTSLSQLQIYLANTLLVFQAQRSMESCQICSHYSLISFVTLFELQSIQMIKEISHNFWLFFQTHQKEHLIACDLCFALDCRLNKILA